MALATFSYHTACTACHGEGTVEVEVESMGGVGGFILQTQGCRVCKGSGASDNVVTVTYCDVCDCEDCAGCEVDAPGFTPDAFAAGVAKAKARAYFHIDPAGNGAVRVESNERGAVYHVTRERCDCPAGRTHGYCYHRAAVIYVHDVCGVNVCTTSIVGFDPAGKPVTREDAARAAA